MPEKFTPEEYEQLADSPADSAHVVDDDPEEAPEGVVEEGDDGEQ